MLFSLTTISAGAQEIIVHIHFHAKYRIEGIRDLFGTPDEQFSDLTTMDADLNRDKAAQKEGKHKRADLLKMHA